MDSLFHKRLKPFSPFISLSRLKSYSIMLRVCSAALCAVTIIVFTPLVQAEVLSGYIGCTYENQYEKHCLPNISKVKEKLIALDENLTKMIPDRHSWDRARYSSPGDSIIAGALKQNKRHVQSIQYWHNKFGHRYLITSMGDEHGFEAAVQIIDAGKFGDTGEPDDKVFFQSLLLGSTFDSFNHPGGSQMIGDFLFIALEDFATIGEPGTSIGDPVTGIFQIRQTEEGYPTIGAWGVVLTTNRPLVPDTDPSRYDYHQSTAAVTKLADGKYLLATCVGPDGCDNMNFYKSRGVI